MARLDHVLTVGWRLRPTPTADGGGSSNAAVAADDDDDDDEVQELSAAEFKRQTTRLVRSGVEVQAITKGGVLMKGLFTRYRIPACEFVGIFLGAWYSDVTYQELLEDEREEPRPRPFETYAIRSGEEEINGHTVHLICAPEIAKGSTSPDPEQSKLWFANEPNEERRANCQLCELVLEEDDLDGSPPNRTSGPFVAFVLITTEVVERDHELTWSYGQSYAPNRQGYRAGAPASGSCDDFNFRDYFPGGVPVRAVSDYVPTATDSSQSSGDDPEYTGAALAQLSF